MSIAYSLIDTCPAWHSVIFPAEHSAPVACTFLLHSGGMTPVSSCGKSPQWQPALSWRHLLAHKCLSEASSLFFLVYCASLLDNCWCVGHHKNNNSKVARNTGLASMWSQSSSWNYQDCPSLPVLVQHPPMPHVQNALEQRRLLLSCRSFSLVQHHTVYPHSATHLRLLSVEKMMISS